jgi:hypothetical protein
LPSSHSQFVMERTVRCINCFTCKRKRKE